MQPIDHISIGVEYSFCPNKISGALYHKVTKFLLKNYLNEIIWIYIKRKLQTSWVKVLIGTPKALAKPKSASLIAPPLSISKFWGLRSLWRILFEWQYLIAEIIW